MHGGGEDERGGATQGKTDLIMDNLIAEGKAKPMLIVMLDGNMASAGFNAGALKAFEAELMQAVIPFVEDNYRVRKEADSRALAGLSMGRHTNTLCRPIPYRFVRSSRCIQFRMATFLPENRRWPIRIYQQE